MRPSSNRRLLTEIRESPIPQMAAVVPDFTDVGTVHGHSSSMAVSGLFVILALFAVGLFARHFLCGAHDGGSSHHRRLPPSHTTRYGRSCFATECGLEPAAVKALPLLRYVGGRGKEGCVVCLTEFEEEETVKLVPGCGHVFHPQCIDAWLVSKGSCPICRCSDIFGSALGREGSGGGEVRVGLFEDGGGEEEFGEQEVEEVRGREEPVVVEMRGREGKKDESLGRRSSSCTWREGRDRIVMSLRRTGSL